MVKREEKSAMKQGEKWSIFISLYSTLAEITNSVPDTLDGVIKMVVALMKRSTNG